MPGAELSTIHAQQLGTSGCSTCTNGETEAHRGKETLLKPLSWAEPWFHSPCQHRTVSFPSCCVISGKWMTLSGPGAAGWPLAAPRPCSERVSGHPFQSGARAQVTRSWSQLCVPTHSREHKRAIMTSTGQQVGFVSPSRGKVSWGPDDSLLPLPAPLWVWAVLGTRGLIYATLTLKDFPRPGRGKAG